jgi:hypothetical protein
MEEDVKRVLDGLTEALASNSDMWKAVGNNAAEIIAARISISILLALNPRALEKLTKAARRIIDGIDNPDVRENLRRIFSEHYGVDVSTIQAYTLHLPN